METWDANTIALQIKEERKGLPKITIFSENDTDDAPFWDLLGGKGPIKEKDTYVHEVRENEKILM